MFIMDKERRMKEMLYLMIHLAHFIMTILIIFVKEYRVLAIDSWSQDQSTSVDLELFFHPNQCPMTDIQNIVVCTNTNISYPVSVLLPHR